MQLYGREWTRREVEARTGRIEQIGGVRRLRLQEGREDGVEMIQVRTGAGLEFNVSPHRGLDISLAQFLGTPLSWQSPNGDAHPAYFHGEGLEWLRTAAGGLMMTCGMRQVGSPCIDEGESLGIHGRAHHLAASHVAAQGEWIDDNYVMTVSGRVDETRIFGENLRYSRIIQSRLGENVIRIQDTVENAGFATTPFMMLYHFNFGWPLIGEKTRFLFPSRQVQPREKETPLEGYTQWSAPDPAFKERVYYHGDFQKFRDPKLGIELAEVTLSNPEFPAGGEVRPVKVSLRWSVESLPTLVQWKMPGAGTHVLGIEPSNCFVGGRKLERERKALRFLEPGESAVHFLEVAVLAG